MTKKIFTIAFVIFALLFSSSFIYASDNLGTELKDSWNKTTQTANNVGGAIKNTTTNVMNAAGATTQNVARGVTTATNPSSYTATRTGATSARTGFLGMSNMAWTWLVLAITGVVIVSLVWYYGNQNTTTRIKDED